jgi:hypothetical protein
VLFTEMFGSFQLRTELSYFISRACTAKRASSNS